MDDAVSQRHRPLRQLLPWPQPEASPTEDATEDPTEDPNYDPNIDPALTSQTPTLPSVEVVIGTNRSDQPTKKPKKQYTKGIFKRMTQPEEIQIFKLCNKYASTFGHRQALCKWWNTVTDEFLANHVDRPHTWTWHSVRRRVENASKQRMKFHADQEALGSTSPATGEYMTAAGEPMKPELCALIDEWLPVWKQQIEAETKRKAIRDEKVRDLRARRVSELRHLLGSDSPDSDAEIDNTADGPGSTRKRKRPRQKSPEPFSPASVRLPPGYENLFSNMSGTSPSSPAQVSTPNALPSTQVSAESDSAQIPPSDTQTPTRPATTASAPDDLVFDDDDSVRIASPDTQPQPAPTVSTANEPVHENQGSARIASPNTQPRPAPVVSAADQPVRGGEDTALDSQDDSPDIISAELRRFKAEIRREVRNFIEQTRSAVQERMDSVQKTQELILQMLRQRNARP